MALTTQPTAQVLTYLDFLDKEYLAPFVGQGGAAVKLLTVADEPSASLEPVPSTEHDRPEQLVVNDAVGAAFGASVGGESTTDQTTPRRLAESATAVRPPAGPVPSGPLSATAATMRPEPEPTLSWRLVTPDGSAHVVVALASDEELEGLDLNPTPVLEPAPPAGANVEFVVPGEPLVRDGVGQVRMRVHERGVGETLSCGTGVAATALAVRHWAGERAPHQWRVEVPGGTLGVRMFPAEDGEHVALSGPAQLVYRGEIDLV